MIGTQGGKILLKDGKVQRGCECCACRTNYSGVLRIRITVDQSEPQDAYGWRLTRRVRPPAPASDYREDFGAHVIQTGTHVLERISVGSGVSVFRKTFEQPFGVQCLVPEFDQFTAIPVTITVTLFHIAAASGGQHINFSTTTHSMCWQVNDVSAPYAAVSASGCVSCASPLPSGLNFDSRPRRESRVGSINLTCDDGGYQQFGTRTFTHNVFQHTPWIGLPAGHIVQDSAEAGEAPSVFSVVFSNLELLYD